jgi:HPt (histidine-containing phosphotransfer) domain-containing protein
MKICNLDYLKSVTPGSNAFAIEIIKLFLQDIPESITVIKTELQNANFEGIYKHAHKIKPSITMVGAPAATSDAILKINELAKAESELEQITELTSYLESELEKIYADLSDSLKEME